MDCKDQKIEILECKLKSVIRFIDTIANANSEIYYRLYKCEEEGIDIDENGDNPQRRWARKLLNEINN